MLRSYIDWMLDIPWSHRTEDRLDLKRAEAILDEDHYGLEEVKDRILEYLAVCQLAQDIKGPILCLTGPPGVGKPRWPVPWPERWTAILCGCLWGV